jgi:DNA-nicking Smr family endonuclease
LSFISEEKTRQSRNCQPRLDSTRLDSRHCQAVLSFFMRTAETSQVRQVEGIVHPKGAGNVSQSSITKRPQPNRASSVD